MNEVTSLEQKPATPVELIDGLALLRAPFLENQISKLPKPTKKQTDEVRADYKKGIRCDLCGQWHHKDVVHLDYVGHAALTDRLLDADPLWNWEPVAIDERGAPLLDHNGGMWIRLTVCGQTRLGYGDAEGKKGGNAIKEVIGDALRNAAMRFGAALDLWHKGELHVEEKEPEPPFDAEAAFERIKKSIAKTENRDDLLSLWNGEAKALKLVTDEQYESLKEARDAQGLSFNAVKNKPQDDAGGIPYEGPTQ